MTDMKKIFDWIITIALAVLLSLGVRTYIAEARWIPSPSMLPTLQIGDRLLIEKVTLKLNGISRGDIIVFEAPQASKLEQVMIKRVIGLPGDTVSIRNSVVYINGTPLEEPYELEKPKDDFKPYKIPENSVFVMGDNRNNSFDSRYWGEVPVDHVIGKALVRFYPLNTAMLF